MFVTDNKPIPTALRKEAISIHKTLDWDDEGGDGKCLVDTSTRIYFVNIANVTLLFT